MECKGDVFCLKFIFSLNNVKVVLMLKGDSFIYGSWWIGAMRVSSIQGNEIAFRSLTRTWTCRWLITLERILFWNLGVLDRAGAMDWRTHVFSSANFGLWMWMALNRTGSEWKDRGTEEFLYSLVKRRLGSSSTGVSVPVDTLIGLYQDLLRFIIKGEVS